MNATLEALKTKFDGLYNQAESVERHRAIKAVNKEIALALRKHNKATGLNISRVWNEEAQTIEFKQVKKSTISEADNFSY